jgi:hypothetical protein
MPPKKNENYATGKDSAHTIQPKPIELETDVQDCPETAKPANITSSANNPKASSIEGKNLLDIIRNDEHTPFTRAENNLYCVLRELQEIHDKAYKTNAAVIAMARRNHHEYSTSVGMGQGSKGSIRRKPNSQIRQAHPDKYCGSRAEVRRHPSQSCRE